MIRIKQNLSTKARFLVNKLTKLLAALLRPKLPLRCLLCSARTKRPTSPQRTGKHESLLTAIHGKLQPPGDLCADCWSDLPWNTTHCACCALPLDFGPHYETNATDQSSRHDLLCGECLIEKPGFDRIYAPLKYAFPVDYMTKQLKYDGKRYYAKTLSACTIQALPIPFPAVSPSQNIAILPVPSDPDRASSRPLNHTLLLARQLSRFSGIPLLTKTLVKTRSSPPQAGLNRNQRLRNLKHCFALTRPIPEQVILIDDVVTTGATADTLSRLLKQHGARQVDIWVIARTPRPSA